MMTLVYGTAVSATKTKAATPITGGMICPPDDAAASTPPANSGLKPVFFIIGIVNRPVDNTLVTGPPVIVPNIADETIAACAGPPRSLRVHRTATLISAVPPAHDPNKDPKMTYGKTWLTTMSINRPINPSGVVKTFVAF